MARPIGAKGKISGDVRDALLKAFHRGGADRWLSRLMVEDVKSFCSLLSRCVPVEVAATINHNLVDLGAAMIEAQRRVDQPMIDVTPNGEDDGSQIGTLADLSG